MTKRHRIGAATALEGQGSKPMNRPTIAFRIFNGLLFGVGLGIFMAYLMAWNSLLKIANQHDAEIYFGPITLLSRSPLNTWWEILMPGLLWGSLVGGGLGMAFGYATRRQRHASSAIAVMGYGLAIVLIAAPFYASFSHETHRSERKETRERENSELVAAWNQSYGTAYPRSEESLPALLGPLYYPESRLQEWPPATLGNQLTWRIKMTSTDTLEHVLTHYMAVLPEGLLYTDQDEFKSEAQESKDIRSTTVSIKKLKDHVQILCETHGLVRYQQAVDMPSITVAWPEDDVARHAQVSAYQQRYRINLKTLFTPLLGDDARLLTTHVSRTLSGAEGQSPHLQYPNGVYRSSRPWESVLAQLGKHLEISEQTEQGATFLGMIADASGMKLMVTVEAHANQEDPTPFDGVTLVVGTTHAEGAFADHGKPYDLPNTPSSTKTPDL